MSYAQLFFDENKAHHLLGCLEFREEIQAFRNMRHQPWLLDRWLVQAEISVL